MNIRNTVVEITLGSKNFKMKFDFETIANVQIELKKKDLDYSFVSIFKGVEEQDYSIIIPVLVNSIRRMHPQIKPEAIKDLLTFDESENIIEKLVELIDASMPKGDSKKKEEITD